MKTVKTYTFRTIIEPDGKYFHGYVPALRGCHTYGKTIKETQKHLKEAMELYVECMLAHKEDVPEDIGLESVQTISFPLKVSRKQYA